MYRTGKTRRRKYKPRVCYDKMNFEECELAVLRQTVDKSEAIQGAKVAKSPEVIQIIQILEDFLRKKKLICYGGTAINNILPKEAQFYDRDVEVPDYDFFSANALKDAKELADIYYLAGYVEVEAKAGVHFGTYKVYVNFLPIADITYLHPTLFANLEKEAISVDGIQYAPPNYLRMSMYLELSRPQGDVSRWEKVLKRINILNKHYPLKADIDCSQIDFQRQLDDDKNESNSDDIYVRTRDSLITQGAVFLGGYGTALYARYMERDQRRKVKQIPDFDVLAESPEECANAIRKELESAGYKKIKLVQHTSIGEVIPSHIEVKVETDIIAMIYKPIACHSYNEIMIAGQLIRVATIDTMLSFYLAFLYGDKMYFNKDRMICMAMYLFQVEEGARLEQKGLLRRFSLKCYGKQPTLESIRAEKAKKYEEFRATKGRKMDEEREKWFLRYNPAGNKPLVQQTKKKSISKTRRGKSPEKTMTLPIISAEINNPIEEKELKEEDSQTIEKESVPLQNERIRKSRKIRTTMPIKGEPYAKRTFDITQWRHK